MKRRLLFGQLVLELLVAGGPDEGRGFIGMEIERLRRILYVLLPVKSGHV
jgi:hypothetical protein